MQQLGKYQLIRQLATGGMAEVFLAKAAGPMGFEKHLVLKRVLPHLALDPSFVQMFLGEAKLAAQLNHPNIVQIFDFGESAGAYYLAMEFIDGPSLRKLLDDSLKLGGPLPPAIAARLISAACEGLAFAHDFKDPATGRPLDIVHRDISPDNILVSRQGAVKVVDFGIAKAADQQHRTQTGIIKGKLAYMPPEQIRNDQMDRQADVYALGVVFYELLTGQRPFNADTDVSLMHTILFDPPKPAARLRPELPEPVLHILERATAKDRHQRYPDCLAFQAALEEYLLSTGKSVTTGHLAQFIAQVSPPAQDAPFLPLPLPTTPGPLTDTALRPAPSQPEELPGRPLITDTLIRSVPSESPLPAGVDAFPAQPVTAPPPDPLPRATLPAAEDTLLVPAVAAPAARSPSRMSGPLRAAIAGAVLLVAGGGYLLSQRSGPPQPGPAPAPVAPATGPARSGDATPTPAEAPATPQTGPEAAAPATPPATEEARADQLETTGTIEIEVRPSAIIYLQGKRLGQATPLASVNINPGVYTLKFVNKKLRKVVEKPIEVKAGRTAFVLVDLLHDEEAQKP
ncbi:MAG: serine/threonine protein kinase [Hyalangium sp.]|uniref:serine/threonine protein kinase n=1 Tax=Hyalangium sp. TaxID=2028555 RepID=UPI00389AF971